jgi:REP element-mobilizing transposase RayT
MNRGKGRQMIFHGEDYYEAFLQCLMEAHKRFGVEVHSYSLMGNHYHLLIKTPRANLSRVMRHINGLYTQRYNRLKKTDGSLFRGRYKAIVIDATNYLLQVSRYIHRNPIDMRKPLTEELEHYPWSSYRAFINKEAPKSFLNRDVIYGELGSRNRYQAYKRFVAEGNDQDTSKFYALKQTPSVMGDKEFKFRSQQQARIVDEEIDKKGLKNPVEIAFIIKGVATFYQVSEKSITHAKRGKGEKNIPRWVVMKLCQEIGGAKLIEIAKQLNISHYSTVSQTIGRLNALIIEDNEVRAIFVKLSQDLTP